MVRRSASAFIWATISRSPVPASVATQVMSPSALNLGSSTRPSSTRSVELGEPETTGSGKCSSRDPHGLAVCAAHHGKEANLLVQVLAERTGELRSNGFRTGLLDAAHRHAHVFGFHHDGSAARLENLIESGRDLRGHVFLGLQTTRIDVHETSKLGQTNHTLHRLVGDMGLASERHNMVLAVGAEADIAHQHEIVVFSNLAEGTVEHLCRTFMVAAKELVVGIDHAPGRLDQTLAVRIIARVSDQRSHGCLSLLAGGSRGWRALPQRLGQGGLRPGFDNSVHDGLSVRPVPQTRAGGVTGADASVVALCRTCSPRATIGRRIPIRVPFATRRLARLRIFWWPPASPYILALTKRAIGTEHRPSLE